ncbi:hypothetical protein [Streptomyces brasiliensis]|uniref:Uncharacterized protein n=1 Tax=Streptomyces brasiliensis TaxID=1954 RepID=A0A917L5V8_9ACTN|nr:hypothetical protein [Streptomyces brasiliensis]GGJ43958.1 hypothetical protein GCM10010121_063950 [Streptomyces brasiliensis]
MVKLTRDSRTRSAEVDEVSLRDGQIRLLWTLVGTDTDRAVLLLMARGRGHCEMRLPAVPTGDQFQIRLRLESLATARTAHQWIWDLYVDPRTGEEPLRLGRHPDGATGRQDIIDGPSQHAAGAVVEPYFTIKKNLSLRCTRGRVC